MKNSSNSSKKICGNSRQISCAKHWFLTYNNYPEDWKEQFVNNELIEKYILGKEVGKSGTPHIQGNISFREKVRPKELFDDKIHWEKTRNLKRATNYCNKEGDFIVKGYVIPKPVRVITPDKKWEEDILERIIEEPDDRSIYWYYGKGGIGKTAFCKYLCVKHKAIMVGGKGADMRNAIVEYKKSTGETPRLLLINIPKSFNMDYISYEGMENIKDMLFYSGKYEGGMVCGNPPHLLVFGNEEPDYDRMSQDRWNVCEIE